MLEHPSHTGSVLFIPKVYSLLISPQFSGKVPCRDNWPAWPIGLNIWKLLIPRIRVSCIFSRISNGHPQVPANILRKCCIWRVEWGYLQLHPELSCEDHAQTDESFFMQVFAGVCGKCYVTVGFQMEVYTIFFLSPNGNRNHIRIGIL